MLTTINENESLFAVCDLLAGAALMRGAAERSHYSVGVVRSGAPGAIPGADRDASRGGSASFPRIAFTVTINMAKSIRVTSKKRRGRPATTGAGTQIGERWHDAELAAIDAWIAATGETLTRGQAIRRLVKRGLAVKTKATPTGRHRVALVADLAAEAIDSLGLKVKTPATPAGKPGRRLRAQELATRAIDKTIDPAAPLEARAQHRRKRGSH
jgi:hypothetical protein